MKIRNGFVSNSSSSSFVVAFPKKFKMVEELRQYMFKDVLYLSHPYQREAVSTFKVAEIVFNDMKSQKPNDLKKITGEFGGIGYSGEHEFVSYAPNSTDESSIYKKLAGADLAEIDKSTNEEEMEWKNKTPIPIEERQKRWEKDKELVRNMGEKLAIEFLEKHRVDRPYTYIFHYADENGELGSFMEHGNIFYNVPHVIFSHH